MRSNPAEYDLVAPGSLQAVVSLLNKDPGAWLPIAGGTDVMVQYAAGKLGARKLVSIWDIPELRRIDVTPEEIRLGAGSTYTELREHPVVRNEFPLLASAARWTGGIANQNRGTLGGNIVNASPAADSLPALLAYEAELMLVSLRGERRLPYTSFHIGYKETKLAPDELIQAVCIPRRFSGYVSYARKVGARNAQAISKVCVAALGLLKDGAVEDPRIACGSVAPVPLRLTGTERMLNGALIEPALLSLARKSAEAELRPIDDIRSTAKYRAAVAGNLVVEFLETLAASAKANPVLARWNSMPHSDAANEILPCCGSLAWARALAGRRPVTDESSLLSASDEVCRGLAKSDWMQAFSSHPRIGESRAPESALALARSWSAQEQVEVAAAGDAVKIALAEANREYERRFQRVFIVCATGKPAAEILQILQRRLENDADTELQEAAEQQRQITHIRLQKWLTA